MPPPSPTPLIFAFLIGSCPPPELSVQSMRFGQCTRRQDALTTWTTMWSTWSMWSYVLQSHTLAVGTCQSTWPHPQGPSLSCLPTGKTTSCESSLTWQQSSFITIFKAAKRDNITRLCQICQLNNLGINDMSCWVNEQRWFSIPSSPLDPCTTFIGKWEKKMLTQMMTCLALCGSTQVCIRVCTRCAC